MSKRCKTFLSGDGKVSCIKIGNLFLLLSPPCCNRFHLHSAGIYWNQTAKAQHLVSSKKSINNINYIPQGLTVSCLRKKNEVSLRNLITVALCNSFILQWWLFLKSVVSKHLRGNLFDGIQTWNSNACISQLQDYIEIIAHLFKTTKIFNSLK